MPEIMKLYASLHAHSTHSDGVYTPEQLAEVGAAEGYKALVLTDHDTVTGTDDMIRACKKRNMDCMIGIEFSAKFRNTHIHITAFHFDPELPELKEYLRQLSYKETSQTKFLFERGIDIGYIKNITWDDVLEYNAGVTWICNNHVFNAMEAKGLIDKKQYTEFFETCFGKHRDLVKSDIEFKHVSDIISMVHSAGGITCAAHPVGILKSAEEIEELFGYGIDGIEVWHGLLKGRDRKRALEIAREYDLYVSGGADHEGLLGGQYSYFENPMQSQFYFPPLTLGTTKYFFEEIRDMKKKADRKEIMDRMISDDSLWITNGGINDQP